MLKKHPSMNRCSRLGAALLGLALLAGVPALSSERQTSAKAAAPSASQVNYNLFEDSRVRRITPFTIEEEDTSLPTDILPMFIGSGRIGVGLDASGMQALDCTVGSKERYRKAKGNNSEDLYVFHERMISNHISTGNVMPLGWFAYDLVVDGQPTDLLAKPLSVKAWRRSLDLQRGQVTTSLELRAGVRLTILAFTPYDQTTACFRFTAQSADGREHRVLLRPRLNLILRPRTQSRPVVEKMIEAKASGASAYLKGRVEKQGSFQPYEDYDLVFGVAASEGAACKADQTVLSAEKEWTLKQGESARLDVAFSLPDKQPAGLDASQPPVAAPELDKRLRAHALDYEKFFAQAGQIHIGDARRELIFNNSLYLLRAGATYRQGCQLQFMLFHPECWFGATFWDTNFTIDALVRTNQLATAQRFVEWLAAAARPQGRPFNWLNRHDGKSAMPADWVDTGYLVGAAHATSAIRLYETTKDRALLEKTIYPLVARVADYAAAERFVKEGDHYIGVTAGHDVNTEQHVNETYTTAWFAMVLRKAADYAELLKTDPARAARWREIVNTLQLQKGPEGYGQSRTQPKPANWVSMLLYPTEAAPLLEMGAFKRNRASQNFAFHYQDFQRCHQPWVSFWQSCSDFRIGDDRADYVEEQMQEGTAFVYGPAYLSEIVPLRTTDLVGMPPYLTPHSAYVTASAEQLFSGSIWDSSLQLFAHLPTTLRGREIAFERLRSQNGVEATAHWTPEKITAELRGEGHYTMGLRAPVALEGLPLTLTINGKVQPCSAQNGLATVELELKKGQPLSLTLAVAQAK